MKNHPLWVLILVSLLFSLGVQAKEDCSCPKVSCGPCQKQVQIGKRVKFCSWGDINVCKKIICENVSGYFQCLAGPQKKQRSPASQASNEPKEDLILLYEQKVKKKRKSHRHNAIRYLDDEEKDRPIDYNPAGLVLTGDDSRSFSGNLYSDKKVAHFLKGHRKIELQHQRGILNPKKGQKIFVGDEISNPGKKTAKIQLKLPTGKVSFSLSPGAKIRVQDPLSLAGRFEPFFHLLYGDVRIKGKMTSGGLDILAGQIIVRFGKGVTWIQYQKAEGLLLVNVEEHKGSIRVLGATNLSSSGVVVPEGSAIQWQASKRASSLEQNLLASVEDSGLITPVFQLPMERRKALGLLPKPIKPEFQAWAAASKKNRGLASSESHGGGLCDIPEGEYESCAWSCEGNPKGAKNCRIQKKGTRCVRRVCNAAGQWGLPTGFEDAYSDLCPAKGVRVGACRP